MLRLKTILQYRYTTLIFLLIVILISFIRYNFKEQSSININTKEITGTILDYNLDGNKLNLIIKDKEKIKATYYLKAKKELTNYQKSILGYKVKLIGTLSKPKKNTIPNTFNYQEYLYNNNIYLTMNVDSVSFIGEPNTIYKIKNCLIDYINTFKSKVYLNMFIVGNKKYLDEDTYNNYKSGGVLHIFAISGMHISLLSLIILKLLFKSKESTKYLIVSIFLILYMFITSFSPSVVRSSVVFILLFINKHYTLNLKTINVFYLGIGLILLFNYKMLFNTGFLYSSVISFSLIYFSYYIKGNYLIKLIKISVIAMLFSLPITINMNYEINILSILNNLLFVPLISLFVYPLSLITLLIKPLDIFFFNITNVVEFLSSKLLVLNIVIPKMPWWLIVVYYLVLMYAFINNNKKPLLVLIAILAIHKYSYLFDNNYYIYFLNVGQGDSTLIRHKNDAILIDTGGKVVFQKEPWMKTKEYYITDNTMIFMKSIGIDSIDMILTHGDQDHMGEAVHVVKNFRVNNIILNCGKFNTLEKNIIKSFKNYKSCITKYKFLSFLNTKEYSDENGNSIVAYFKVGNKKVLLMGDAGVEREKDILEKYKLSNIDILKVGHHGSKTSSSQEFINTIKPKYSIISVGVNNGYGHPNKEVLDNLSNSKKFRTDEDGSVMFKINNDKLKIEICCL